MHRSRSSPVGAVLIVVLLAVLVIGPGVGGLALDVVAPAAGPAHTLADTAGDACAVPSPRGVAAATLISLAGGR